MRGGARLKNKGDKENIPENARKTSKRKRINLKC